MELREGDILCTYGNSWISRAIRFFSRFGGESRCVCNHVGVIVTDGTEDTAILVEALSTVRAHEVLRYDNADTCVAIFRPVNVTKAERVAIANRAYSYVGAKYGYFKLVAHFFDWCLGGRYFFRRLARMEKYPICSWVVADAYARVGLDFGVLVGQASPDDIWDYCISNPDKYAVVHSFSPLKGWKP